LGVGADDRGLGGEGIGHLGAWVRLRDKPDYHVEDRRQGKVVPSGEKVGE
jgi:hypothetical protein